jgi:hypothetical protein
MNPNLDAIASRLDRLVALQQKGPWDYIATIAVVLTLVVLIWYTIETYKLRKAAQTQTTETEKLLTEAQRQNETSLRLVEQAQRQNDVTANLVTEAQRQNETGADLVRAAYRQNETAIMPVLAIRVEPPQARHARSHPNERSHLVLRNEGTGPAFNVSIEPYSAAGRELEFDHGSSVIRPGEERELTYHLQEGNGGTIGNVNELYYWINTGTLPDPLFLRIHCRSVSSTDYTFTFRFTPMVGTLAVLLERMELSGTSTVN